MCRALKKSGLLPKIFLAFVLLLMATACGEKKETRIRLTSAERVKVDTLYSKEVKTLRPYLDSLCEAQFDSLVQRAVDSLLEVRRAEEIRLRNRIPKGQ